MPATAQNVSFDILLGGKITPEAIKALTDMEAKLKAFGASTRTVNAAMREAYKQTFNSMAEEGRKASDKLEREFKHSFERIGEHAREAGNKMKEAFEKPMEFARRSRERLFEFFGISGVIGTVTSAVTFEELIRHGTEVHVKREEALNTLAATLRGRGRADLIPEYRESIETLAKQAPVGYDFAAEMLRKLAATGKFGGAQDAERFARSLIAVSGGTKEGAEGALGSYERMLLGGKITPKAIAGLSRGSGFSILAQISKDTGIAVTDLSKAFGPKGAIGPVQGLQMLKKAIIELGEGQAAPLLAARLKGTQGLFYRLGEDWENFLDKIGEIWTKIIDPIANEINEWLDSINWENTFSGLIEKSREWGQTIRNVFDMILKSPVAERFQAIWDRFWSGLVGGDMYGPWVKVWNDNLKKAAGGTHWARHLTPSGEKFLNETANKIEGILSAIVTAFQWFVDHGAEVLGWLVKITEAFAALKAIEVANSILTLVSVLTGPGGLALAILGVTGYFAKLTESMLKFAGTEEGKKMTKEAEQARFHPGAGAADIAAIMAAEAGTSSPAARAAAQQGLQYTARTNDKAAEAALHQADALERLNKLDEEVRKNQELHNKQIQEATKTTGNFQSGLQKATGNDLVHFTAATAAATQALTQLSQLNLGMLGGSGVGAGIVGGAHFTEYGPAVPGDQPGGPTYDKYSYNRVGAWPGITGPLRAGDVALGILAQAKYHVMPGQSFTDEYGRTWRFADRSGSKDPYNVDVFRGAQGGIVTGPTRAYLGEAGPEAVIPLSGRGAGLGMTVNVNFGDITSGERDPRTMFSEFAETIAREVHRVVEAEWRRSAVI